GAQIKDRRSRDDLANRANALANTAGPARISTTAGDVSFLTRQNQAGYVLASTQLTSVAGVDSAMWFVTTLGGYTAPPERVRTASAAMALMLDTFQVNPQWYGAQQQATAQTSRIVTETNAYVSRLQSESYWASQASQDRVYQNYSDATRGIQVVVDPNTGQKYEAVAGHNYYYMPPNSNTTIATDVQAPPNIDLVELLPTRR